MAVVAPSHRPFPARATLLETATFTSTAVATDVATTSPVFVIVSLPTPALIPSALAFASALETAPAMPSMEIATPSDGTVATDVATTSPSLLMVSSPPAISEESDAPIITSPSTTPT